MPESRSVRSNAVFKAYSKAAWKHSGLVMIALVGVIGGELAGVTAPIYLSKFINILSSSTPSATLAHSLLTTLGVFALISIGGWLMQSVVDISSSYMELRVMTDLYDEAFRKLLRQSHEFFISNFTGSLTRRVTRYARAFEQIFDTTIYNLLPAILFATGAIMTLSFRSIELGVGLLVWTIVFVYLQLLMTRRIQPLRTKSSEADSAVTGTLSDAVMNHATITTFATLPHERVSFGEKVSDWYRATRIAWDADIRITRIQSFLAVTINIGILYAAVFFWQKGALTVGDFVLIQVYIIGLMDRIWGIGRSVRRLYEAFADATEMLDVIEQPLDIADKPGAKSLSIRNGSILFDHVSFAYGNGKEVLSECSLRVDAKEKIALVGSSGAGKSTVTKLLLRLYNVSSGAITIDDQNIADTTQESVRNAIAFVPQEPALFHRTLRENIRYGRPGATDEEVSEAARKAHCLEFIAHYPDGFDTLVGERGVKLSGGERQRVAIARAILKDAPILVLDEATSSLDSESEALIQDALAKLMEGKTVIVIAHRLSTIMKMDRIVVMEHGKVALSGTHDELLAQESNLYKKLWEIQAGGFIAADESIRPSVLG